MIPDTSFYLCVDSKLLSSASWVSRVEDVFCPPKILDMAEFIVVCHPGGPDYILKYSGKPIRPNRRRSIPFLSPNPFGGGLILQVSGVTTPSNISWLIFLKKMLDQNTDMSLLKGERIHVYFPDLE